MILCLDVGNSQIHGGVFKEDSLQFQFRKTSKGGSSSDEYGLFLRSVLRENDIEPASITKIAICTVVPEVTHSLRNCCMKYFNLNPFLLQAGVKTGMKVNYRNPLEVGADRIANALAATHIYPDENIIIVDFGTATTFCAVNKNREYLGGVILAGLKISVEALESKTAKLPSVEIVPTEKTLGRSTVEGIQAGLYHGNVGALKEIIGNISNEVFGGALPRIIGTGGFTRLFTKEKLFDVEVPDLVLKGLYLALKLNT